MCQVRLWGFVFVNVHPHKTGKVTVGLQPGRLMVADGTGFEELVIRDDCVLSLL